MVILWVKFRIAYGKERCMVDQVEASSEGNGGVRENGLANGQVAEPGKKRRVKGAEAGLKTRCIISTDSDHPFSKFQAEIKERGVKGFDPGELLREILDTLPEEFWSKKLEELTPLEYKINAALSDPEMREKLTLLLASEEQRQ